VIQLLPAGVDDQMPHWPSHVILPVHKTPLLTRARNAPPTVISGLTPTVSRTICFQLQRTLCSESDRARCLALSRMGLSCQRGPRGCRIRRGKGPQWVGIGCPAQSLIRSDRNSEVGAEARHWHTAEGNRVDPRRLRWAERLYTAKAKAG
jgi:hypothetical protein